MIVLLSTPREVVSWYMSHSCAAGQREVCFLPLHLSPGKLTAEDLVLSGPSSTKVHKCVCKPGAKETLNLSKQIKWPGQRL